MKKELKIALLFLLSILLLSPIIVSAASGTTTVYITVTGTKYHKSGCRYLNQSKISISLQDAINDGYSRCSRCHPPELTATLPTQKNKEPTPVETENLTMTENETDSMKILSAIFFMSIILIICLFMWIHKMKKDGCTDAMKSTLGAFIIIYIIITVILVTSLHLTIFDLSLEVAIELILFKALSSLALSYTIVYGWLYK